MEASPAERPGPEQRLALSVLAREWGRIGLIGFGGPPAHVALMRRRFVQERRWLTPEEFEGAFAACNLLPGPASTQLSIFCAYRVAGRRGALVGGLAFIVPAVVIVLALSTLFLAHTPPLWIRGAGDGAGAAIAPVAGAAALGLLVPSWRRAVPGGRARHTRWLACALAGAVAAATIGPYLVLVLLACGVVELAVVVGRRARDSRVSAHGLLPLVWVAVKVGALSYGGGFVIVPLMQTDAVHTYHWLTSQGFLNAVALGQISPGPVVATVAAVGYAAHGIVGGLLAAVVAFAPSFAFVLLGGARFAWLRGSRRAQAFLAGAGPAAAGAILGAALPLASALRHGWQFGVLAAAAAALLLARRGVASTLVAAGAVGVIIALAGGPVT
jgi:chromate transporter